MEQPELWALCSTLGEKAIKKEKKWSCEIFEGASWSEAVQSSGLSPAGEARLVLSPLGSDSALVGNVGVLDIWCFSLAALYTFKASFV